MSGPTLSRRDLALRLAAPALALLGSPRAQAQAVVSADEFRLLPIRIHLLRAAKAPDLDCKLQEADARRILDKINGVWKQAGIQFWAESILSEEAASQELYTGLGENRSEGHLKLVRPKASRSPDVFHLYYVREMEPNGICLDGSRELLFIKDTARLNRVPGGIDEPLPRVSAHEIGHALGLPHRQDFFNLMASGTTGTALNEAEVVTTRAAAEKLPWRLTPQQALAQAGKHAAAGRQAAARALYHALSGLPGGDIAKAARERLEGKG